MSPGSATPEGKPSPEHAHDFCRRFWMCLAAFGAPDKAHSHTCLALRERDALHAETERVMREALERIATKGCALRDVLGPTVTSCLDQPARRREFFCLSCIARRALATAQAMKEAAK